MEDEYNVESEVKYWLGENGDDGRESALLKGRAQSGNAMTRLSTAITDASREYRQALLLALFENKQEALLAADAISERLRYGVVVDPIVDRIIAQCATKGARVNTIIDGLTHNRISTNNSAAAKAFWNREHTDKTGG